MFAVQRTCLDHPQPSPRHNRFAAVSWTGPNGYRVLPPLGLGFNQTSEALIPISIPAPSMSESVSNPASLNRSISSWRTPAVRALSPLQKASAVLVSSVRWYRPRPHSIIRTSPTSLVAYIIGSRTSPASRPTPSPLQSDVCGHLLGIRGSCIPHPNPGNTSPRQVNPAAL